MIDDVIRDTLRSYLGALRPTPNGWQSRNCPMCLHRGHSHDTRGRFGVKFPPEGGVKASCFNCKFLASWQPGWELPKPLMNLMEVLGVPKIDVERIKFNVYKENNSIVDRFTGELSVIKPVTEKWKKVEFPEGTFSMAKWARLNCKDKDFIKAVEYAYKRGVRDFDNVYWNPIKLKQYNRRIIFPFHYNGKLVGWTGRYVGNPASKLIPKYLNIMPESYIYNVDHQTSFRRNFVIVCEGMIDAYFMDGIGTLHSTINEEQIKIINNLNKQIILCPDRDRDGDNLIEIAKENRWHVSFPKWESHIKDPAQAVENYGVILTLKSILDTRIQNSLKIDIYRKFDKTTWSNNE